MRGFQGKSAHPLPVKYRTLQGVCIFIPVCVYVETKPPVLTNRLFILKSPGRMSMLISSNPRQTATAKYSRNNEISDPRKKGQAREEGRNLKAMCNAAPAPWVMPLQFYNLIDGCQWVCADFSTHTYLLVSNRVALLFMVYIWAG